MIQALYRPQPSPWCTAVEQVLDACCVPVEIRRSLPSALDVNAYVLLSLETWKPPLVHGTPRERLASWRQQLGRDARWHVLFSARPAGEPTLGATSIRGLVELVQTLRRPPEGLSTFQWSAASRPAVLSLLRNIEHELSRPSALCLLDRLPSEFRGLATTLKELLSAKKEDLARSTLRRRISELENS